MGYHESRWSSVTTLNKTDNISRGGLAISRPTLRRASAVGPGARRARRTVLPASPARGGPGRWITRAACRLAGQQRLGVRDVGNVADRGHDHACGSRQRRFQLLEIAVRHNPVVPSLNQQDFRVDSYQAWPQVEPGNQRGTMSQRADL